MVEMSSDQCKHCSVRGNIDLCLKEDCTLHDSWYAVKITTLWKKEQRMRRGYERQIQGIARNIINQFPDEFKPEEGGK